MSANPIIYCLENLTDYRQFERLCSDLMAGSGFSQIDPIGGTNDKGRDAIYTSKENDEFTIFAYTVRSDWFVKLKQDCKRIREETHNPDCVVFVCTSDLSGNDKDNAKDEIKREFGWKLEIFDIERIRVLLTGQLRHLLAQHPAIFCPPWFPVRGGLSIAECRDTIVIDHLPNDHSLATWLSRKLAISGYKTWCYGLAPLVGEDKDDSINVLIEQRAIQYIPIITRESFTNTDFIGRISSTIRTDSFVMPCWSEDLKDIAHNSKVLLLEPAKFHSSWSSGLDHILSQLKARKINPTIDPTRGVSVALKAYMPEPVVKAVSERVYSNVFSVTVPKSILICELENELGDIEIEDLRKNWAFSMVSAKKFLSFDYPPSHLQLIQSQRIPEYAWNSFPWREGKNSIDVVKELVKRSLNVACSMRGLEICSNRHVYYFKEKDGKQHNISFVHVDGRKTNVAVTGTIQDGWGDRATHFRYQLSPKFRVHLDEDKMFWVMIQIYIRVTDLNGVPYEGKEIIRKRKKVAKSWWNKQWLARTIGIMQGLANTDGNHFIEIGTEGKRKVIISTKPLDWECPVAIDIDAVERIGDFQEEMASARYFENDDLIAEDENLGNGP